MEWEFQFLNFLQINVVNPIFTPILAFFSYASCAGIIWILFTLYLLIRKDTRKIGFIMAIALIIEVIFVNIIVKPSFQRIRPFNVNTIIDLLIIPPSDYSFPSGHTSVSFTCVTVLLYFKKRKMFFVTLIVAVLTAFSRLYFYIHYPTDIIAGIGFGVLAASIAFILLPLYPVCEEKLNGILDPIYEKILKTKIYNKIKMQMKMLEIKLSKKVDENN